MRAAILGAWHVHAHGYVKDFISDKRCELAGCWDSDATRGTELATKFGCKYYSDIDELFLKEEFDSVIVCSATNEHPAVIIKAAEAKKNIFTEKVLAIKTEDAKRISDAVKKNGVKFVISLPHKCNPPLLCAKKLVESGALGEITYARVRNAHGGSIANWLPPHFYDPVQCGGGAMIDLGAHPMYTLLWLLGMPEKVVSSFTNFTPRAVEDNAVTVFKYKNGAAAVSETSFVSVFNGYVVELSGTEGAFRIIDGKSQFISKATESKWVSPENPPAMPSPLRQWINLVCDGTPAPEFTIDEAVRLTEIMEMAYANIL